MKGFWGSCSSQLSHCYKTSVVLEPSSHLQHFQMLLLLLAASCQGQGPPGDRGIPSSDCWQFVLIFGFGSNPSSPALVSMADPQCCTSSTACPVEFHPTAFLSQGPVTLPCSSTTFQFNTIVPPNGQHYTSGRDMAIIHYNQSTSAVLQGEIRAGDELFILETTSNGTMWSQEPEDTYPLDGEDDHSPAHTPANDSTTISYGGERLLGMIL